MSKKISKHCKRDCFAFSSARFADDGGCVALKKMLCNTSDCPFYKSKEQYDAEQKHYSSLRKSNQK